MIFTNRAHRTADKELRTLTVEVFDGDDEFKAWDRAQGWWASGGNDDCAECPQGSVIPEGRPVYLSGVVGDTRCHLHAQAPIKGRPPEAVIPTGEPAPFSPLQRPQREVVPCGKCGEPFVTRRLALFVDSPLWCRACHLVAAELKHRAAAVKIAAMATEARAAQRRTARAFQERLRMTPPKKT